VFFAYIGFDAVTTLAAEVKNPKRDMPIGIVGTLLIATLMYMGVSLGTFSAFSKKKFLQ
jgi:APA family basic amino acid/polyamine antiporter